MAITPMFPLESVLLPGEELPLRIFEPRYGELVRDCMAAAEQVFGVVLISAGREVGGGEARCSVGAMAHIDRCQPQGTGQYMLTCSVTDRIRILQWHNDDPYPRAEIELWPDEPGPVVAASAIVDVEDRIIALFERIASSQGGRLRNRDAILGRTVKPDVGQRLYALASLLPSGQADKYSVLAAPNASARLDALNESVESLTAMVEFQLSGD
ncbi:LON peptidase substrate-binding domain-containing protein [Mycolicibacterium sp. CBMA 234]|uniref:LON peptidase substrate-binding domain-containing protein n=1 Tax=Mycolicibacterium sp. CBMA 234 TaxID=1918495 RepID=UPI001390DAD5|nr:LON peptidase substrate-binding domain-containing protein [Mycolicibacterium sp. CBMA 234]